VSPETGVTTGTDAADSPGSVPDGGPGGVGSRQAAMEEERDFLIRSLHDLESERAAGDIDQGDYETLRDDYTVRAAALLRRLEEPEFDDRHAADDEPVVGDDDNDEDRFVEGRAGESQGGGATRGRGRLGGRGATGGDGPSGRRRRPWRRREVVAAAGIVVALAALVGWQVGHNISHRSAGETITGANVSGNSLSTTQVDQLLTQAESEAASDPVGAVEVYSKVLAVYPDQPQALTEQAWLYAQAGLLSQAATQLRRAEVASASYDPAHGYLGIVLFGEKDYAGAVSELTYYLAHGPNPALTGQATQALKAAKTDEAAIAKSSSTTVGSPNTTVAP
jgi:hypothetical protein